jgi:outer membrane protein assembly factor BamB
VPSIRPISVILAIFASIVVATCPAAAQEDKDLAAWILQDVPQRSALCVHLGIRDGKLTTALSAGGRNLVNGFTADVEILKRARTHIRSKNLYGMVSVEKAAAGKLPHSDNLVNLVVVDQLRDVLEQGLTLAEVLRVLAPQGVAWIGESATSGQPPLSVKEMKGILETAKLASVRIVERNGIWARLEKPRPQNIDTWTHRRHGPNGNPVSTDQVIQVPSGVQWMAGPQWPTGHRKQSVPSVVISEKRLIYVFQGNANYTGKPEPHDSLVVRDAFNGLPLWKRKAPSDHLVVSGNVIYTADSRGSLLALDADTGNTLTAFKPPKNLKVGGLMVTDRFLLVGSETSLTCLNKDTGYLQWKKKISLKDKNQFIVASGSVFAHVDESRRGKGSFFMKLALEDGREAWTQPTAGWAKSSPDLVLFQADVLVSANKEGNHGVSAKTGKHLWSYTYDLIGHGGQYIKIMAMQNLVWVHTANTQGTKQYAWEGLDPQTGQVTKRIVQPKNFTFKHRCSYDVATERFFMCGSMDFADLKTGQYQHFKAGRNSCATAGMLPANGLLYTFPHACGCYSMLRGFIGFATVDHLASDSKVQPREKGPAYEKPINFPVTATDWPTYRHDATRTGNTMAPGPDQLTIRWTTPIENRSPVYRPKVPTEDASLENEWSHKNGGVLTGPVIAGGSVFTGIVDRHQIVSTDSQTGKVQWQFTAGGRIDCPPTISQQYCLFGCHDGWIYCLRSADGELVWRTRVAPQEKRILAYGQLESIWPVVGGTLVQDNQVFALTGRHAEADGGLQLHALELPTGKSTWSVQAKDHIGLPDVLNGQDGTIQMAGLEFDAQTGKQQKASVKRLRGGELGLLNDAWHQRPIATRKNLQLWTAEDRPSGQLLCLHQETTLGFRLAKVGGGNGVLSDDGELFGADLKEKTSATWSHPLATEARVKAMVSTPQRLYVAGRFTPDRSGPSVIRCYSVTNGKLLAELNIAHELVHDGLAVAGQHLYVTTQSGLLICIGRR